MKKVYIAMFLLFAVFFISACTPDTAQEADTNVKESTTENDVQEKSVPETTVTSTEVKSEETISLDKIYNYDKITNFEYKTTTVASGTTTSSNMKYSLSSDNVNGKAAWLSVAQIDAQGAKVLSKTWTDKYTFECLKTSNVVTFNGKDMETLAECPKNNPQAASNGEIPVLKYVGTESVTVPLGTYTAKKYVLDGMITYWYTDGVPIPIKVTYAASAKDLSVASMMEPVDWN